MNEYDNMNPDEKKASLDGLSMHFTNRINNPGKNLQFPESNLPSQIERKMKELFGLKSFTDDATLTEWGINLATYLKESCSPGNFAEALRFGIDVGKKVNSDYQKNDCMNPEHDPKLKNWKLRLQVAIDMLNENEIEAPKEVLPHVKLSEVRLKIDGYLEHIKEKCFNEKEYQEVAAMFTDHFEGRSVILPDRIIRMTNGSKTKFAQAMGVIHKDLRKPNVTMAGDSKFYDIFRILSQYEGEENTQIYAALKRN